MSDAKSPLTLDLDWKDGLRFVGRTGDVSMTLDGDSQAGPSPVQALAFALAGCMAIDVVHILTRGRTEPRALHAHLVGHRAETDPKRFVRIVLHFTATGDVPADKVERAIALSREKYCSVWHSLRPDLEFTTSFDVTKA